MNIVKVVWLDHWGDINGWLTNEDIKRHEPKPITTVGMLVEDHQIEDSIVVANSVYVTAEGDTMYGGFMIIRSNGIVSMEEFSLDNEDE